MLEYLKKHLINLRGKRLKERIIVIESDDWGAQGFPSSDVSNNLIEYGAVRDNPFSRYDSIETESDLVSLIEVLNSIRSLKGKPVLTANWVMTNPHYEKIRSSNFKEYYYESFLDTYKRDKKTENNKYVLSEGISEGLILPQFHAREHLNFMQWLARLKTGNKSFLTAFDMQCYAVDDDSLQNKRNNLAATYDFNDDEELSKIKTSIKEGLKLFQHTFGFKPKSTIAPCYIWSPDVEEAFLKEGVNVFQGSKYQNVPQPQESKYKRILHYNGEIKRGRIYFVRNVLFEPAFNSSLDWVDKALEGISIAFRMNKPAIICSHRLNFSGRLDLKKRDNNLRDFQCLLKKIIKKWPNVQFLSTEDLVKRFYYY